MLKGNNQSVSSTERRGLHFPTLSTPCYTGPGFIVGIPAVPFIVPFLFGVVLFRRAGKVNKADG